MDRTDVEAAAVRIAGRVHVTPVLRSRTLDALAGAEVHLKAEHLQRTGSFKVRGGFNALLAKRPHAVGAVSSGNHAQAVALAARELGIPAAIVMPADARDVKVAATLAYGAEVVQDGVTRANREEVFRAIVAERALVAVHPFDDPDVMAGQGTAGLELPEDLDVVVVPVGGGGLISGIATAVRCRVVGAAPSDRTMTVCDGLRAPEVGARPREVIERRVEEIVSVPDEATLEAVGLLATRLKQVVEPSGAVALAAVLSGAVSGRRIGVILSGGNV